MRLYHVIFYWLTLLFLIPAIIFEHWLPILLMIISFNLGSWVIDLILLKRGEKYEN